MTRDSTLDHERFMRRCLELAEAAGRGGNTPVGSVVVLGGQVIGEAGETLPAGRSVTGHAEVLACQAAIDSTGRTELDGATLYTTAEPCFMCSYVIRQLRVSRVVHGLETTRIGGISSSHPILTDPTLADWRPAPIVLGGILKEECEQLKAKLRSLRLGVETSRC